MGFYKPILQCLYATIIIYYNLSSPEIIVANLFMPFSIKRKEDPDLKCTPSFFILVCGFSSPLKEIAGDPDSVCGLSDHIIFIGSESMYIQHSLASCFHFASKLYDKHTEYQKTLLYLNFLLCFFYLFNIRKVSSFIKKKN